MGITSVGFLAFTAVSIIIYYIVPKRFQWWVLLADSLIFYFLNSVAYTFVYLLVSVISVYFAALYFEKHDKGKKPVLVLTIVLNAGLLAVLKYTNLAINTVSFIRERSGGEALKNVKWYASLAISFYTLQIIAYLLDNYWGVAEREKNPLKLLLFASYFPQMISGPISRHSELAPQFFKEHSFDYEKVTRGMRRCAFGIAKKVIVADRLAVFVSVLFSDPDTYSGIWAVIAAVLFVIQLYFDFSGCMDIVLGVSLSFGIELTENFKAPFLSRSIQEFWQRWHITLGAWLKAYIMYPILKTDAFSNMAAGCKKRFGKQGKKIPSYIAMLAVWFLMGLWHGNSWKYVVGEGLWFWLIIVLGQVFEPLFKKLKNALHIKEESVLFNTFRVVRTVLLYSFGMIFFNAKSLEASFYMISRMFVQSSFIGGLKSLYDEAFASFGGFDAFFAVLLMFALQIYADFKIYAGKDVQEAVTKRPLVLRWILYFALVLLIITEGAFGQSTFIYFGF
ncbi:MAG: MBOAT family protein [Lachnospiraceae bacterium]|nr:MBOAT family protein [Lachnospiraceae bacterium]